MALQVLLKVVDNKEVPVEVVVLVDVPMLEVVVL